MTQADSNASIPAPRHWLYGLNVAVLVLVAVLIIGLGLFLTARFTSKWDMTSSKLYSLSSYTQQLLKQVDQKNQPYELISLFRSGSEESQQVDDLLAEYARASKNLTVEDFGSVGQDVLMQKIRERYKSELEPYEKATDEFKQVSDDLEKFSKVEGANLSGLAQVPGATPQNRREAMELQGNFGSAIPEIVSSLRRDVKRATESTSPEYGRVTSRLKTVLESVEKQIGLLANTAQVKELVSPAMAKYFEEANPRYKKMDEELKGYLDELGKLKALKVQEVLDSVASNTIVVLGPTAATVVPAGSIFKYNPSSAPGQQATSSFEGEQGVSSALLSMVQPEKVKVVFVTTSPTHPTTNTNEDGWSEMADRLRTSNFDVLEWAPGGSPQPGMPPEPSGPPPAEGKGVVWIVFPPEANPQMMMMGMPPPSPQPVIDALKRHLDAGGEALILAESSGGGMPGASDFPYADAVKPFGIEVEPKYVVVHNYPGTANEVRVFPRIAVTRYPDHAITRPLQSLQTVMQGFPDPRMGGMIGGPTVVEVSKNLPGDVQAGLILQSPRDADTWGETSFARDSKFDRGTDLAPPCPMGVAAERNAGKDDSQRVVVIGSRMIGCNYLLQQIGAASDESSGRLIAFPENPGNAELINNSVLWLAGYKNMISVSAKSAAALRIRDISPVMLATWRWIIFLGLPVLTLVLGGVVWLFRRR